jgi:hypothetical protein
MDRQRSSAFAQSNVEANATPNSANIVAKLRRFIGFLWVPDEPAALANSSAQCPNGAGQIPHNALMPFRDLLITKRRRFPPGYPHSVTYRTKRMTASVQQVRTLTEGLWAERGRLGTYYIENGRCCRCRWCGARRRRHTGPGPEPAAKMRAAVVARRQREQRSSAGCALKSIMITFFQRQRPRKVLKCAPGSPRIAEPAENVRKPNGIAELCGNSFHECRAE